MCACVHVCPLTVHTFVPSHINDFWSVTLVAYVYPNTQAEPPTYAYLHAHTVSQTKHLGISLHYIPRIADTKVNVLTPTAAAVALKECFTRTHTGRTD